MSRFIVSLFIVFAFIGTSFGQVKDSKDIQSAKDAKKVTASAKHDAKKVVKKAAKKADAKVATEKASKAPKKASAKAATDKNSAVDKATKEANRIAREAAKSIKPTKSPETE
jgi:hypothetical protein